MRRGVAIGVLGLFASSFGFGGCSTNGPKISAIANEGATLSGELPANPLVWAVISSSADTKNATMSTLYGNDVAVRHARENSMHVYPQGAQLALVTWTQQEDERWFGAKIPRDVKSVEFVVVGAGASGKPEASYQRWEGKPLKKVASEDAGRMAELVAWRAAVLP